MRASRRLAVIALASLLAACARTPDAPSIPIGAWRATITIPGGELPFGIELARDAGGWHGWVVNGAERAEIERVTVDGDHLVMRSPSFDSTIDAHLVDGALVGTLTYVKTHAVVQTMPLRAVHDAQYRFFPTLARPEIKVDGRWAVRFVDQDGGSYPAVGEFHQDGPLVQGTFLTPTGDYRYLAGEVRGRTLYLSCFDGGHVFLFHATLGDDDRLTGDYWSGMAWHESWTATRDESAALPDPDAVTHLATGVETIDFTFPDLDGHPVSLHDPRFAGKPVVVTLVGSWCPNCHDEARFLAPLYAEYAPRGLEVIALGFEHYGDFPSAARQLAAFRDAFGIRYPILVAGTSDKDQASTVLPMLDHVYAFPTTIFLDRQHRVVRILTGFEGPGTGAHYTALGASYRSTLEALLAP